MESPSQPIVAVFGSSEPSAGDPLYRLAESTGRHLALHGYTVMTGGYYGVMEAACKGAYEAGATTIGVISAIFTQRDPNPYVSTVIDSENLHERTKKLIDHAAAFVVAEGQAGTLAELTLLWALQRAGCLGPRPVILLGDSWEPLVELCTRQSYLGPEQLKVTHRAASPADVLDVLRKLGIVGIPALP